MNNVRASAASRRRRQLRIAAGPGADTAAIDRLARAAGEWQAHSGEALLIEGDAVRQSFVLLSGTATVRAGGEVLARLGPGSAIWRPNGPSPSPLTVTADAAMWVLVLTPDDQLTVRGQSRAPAADVQ